ncbi:uncharacterized protein LOC125495556 [Beta vulgaris subsp. vulgaris]|uniref:uncharacterized protein LOC125495556 n=1 Tax=Beta vulgaris subsp. vulgaris TaxID=3555 RepID=UPI002036BF50|nr:uncharacterized protein LOC125495556 [Beta vulgaris subsp. vulgaris]
MEYLIKCLGEFKDNPDFNFHPKCERITLTHLMFADDLLLFARTNHSSVTKIMAAFRKFSLASGLEASIEKSCIYFAGVSTQEANAIVVVISLRVGNRPSTIAQSWMAKSLSYAIRLQLIRSMLSSMRNYWAHIFLISKKLIKACSYSSEVWTKVLQQIKVVHTPSCFDVESRIVIGKAKGKKLEAQVFVILFTEIIVYAIRKQTNMKLFTVAIYLCKRL